MKKQFCDYCMEETECTYKEKMVKEVIDNKKIEYLKKYYICNTCKNEVIGDLLDLNIISANEELRKQTGLITISEINEIMEKYGIGKKPLSLILGIGEINIIRYLNGLNPSVEISNLLKNILNNSFLYKLFLETNKDKITKIAYKKSLGKTVQIELKNNKSKLYNITLYLIEKLEDADALSIQKLLYFISGFSKSILNEEIFSDLSEAWIHGPVYREIYDALSYYKDQKIDYYELIKEREINLSEKEKEYIDEIIKDFGCYSGSMLRKMTHLTDPWINARKGLKENEPSNRIISAKEMNTYFTEMVEKYNIKKIKDIKKYSNYLFKEANK